MFWSDHQRVVVGVDGSTTSAAAARWSATMALRAKSPLHIATAVQDPALYMAGAIMVLPTEGWEQQRRIAEKHVADLVGTIRESHPGLLVTTEVSAGSAAEMLVRFSHSAGLVVVGNSGTGMMASVLLGSTAKTVLGSAVCPVVVWREVADVTDSSVVVGVDGSATSEAAISHAFELASNLHVSLVAAHAWNPVSEAGGAMLPGLVDWAGLEQEGRALLTESLAGWKEKYPNVAIETVLRQGNAAHVLVELSRTTQLVVVGSHGRRSVARLVLGSTSSNLAYHAHCPVMVCKGVQ
ncbi:MAG: universal stress protein [Rhodococcus sp. (in: high G+C Gram-positive bacteria)]